MANQKQLEILKQGADVWNKWLLVSYHSDPIFLQNKDTGKYIALGFTPANLTEADLSGANLRNVLLRTADLSHANLTKADLQGADLSRANLIGADLSGAKLNRANLSKAYLDDAILNGADLSEANLRGASLVGSEINKAKVSGSLVYAVNVWDLKGEFEEQKDLIITRDGDSIIRLDNIKVAQLIYLILDNRGVPE
jgi:uncharacterized protein YjbI with pentapeptide repeats